MPITTVKEARNEMTDHFTDAWNAQASPVPLLLYQDKKKDIPVTAVPWARMSIAHVDRDRVTIGGETGGTRFRAFGLITVEVYSLYGEGLTNNDVYVNLVIDAFEGQNTGLDRVTFRNVRNEEIGVDGPWFQTNVIAEFEYDIVK